MNYNSNKAKLFVVSNNYKNKLLKNVKFNNIKYISKEELKKFYFDYDYKSIKFLMNKYNIKYDNAKLYLTKMYDIDSIKSDENIFKLIKKMKNELIENKLLIYDETFTFYLKNVDVIVDGYDVLDKSDIKLFEEIKKITNLEIRKNNIYNNTKKIDVYEFNNIEDEVLFLCNNIIDLLNNNIDINNIFITNYSNEYQNIIKKIFNMYNIPININSEDNILNTNIGNYIISLLDCDTECDNIYENILKYLDKNNINLNIYKSIIDICNKYFISKYLDKYDIICIKEELKNIKVNNIKYKNAINIIEYRDNIIDDNAYVFFINFNQGMSPLIFKNEDLYSDDIRIKSGLSTSQELNKLEKDALIQKLYSIKNLKLSYKLSSNFEDYYKSVLVDELDMNIIRNYKIKYNYSNSYNKYLLCKKLDELVKYGTLNTNLNELYVTYPEHQYLEYDNSYNKINKDNLKKYIDNKLILSYTNLDNYNRCSFRYYINNILKLNKIDNKFKIIIGNLYHSLLSVAFKDNFNFDKCFNEYIETLDINVKEKFFLNNLKQDIIDTIETINYQDKFSELDEQLYEEKVFIKNKIDNVDITFMGVVDKVKYKLENNNVYVAIIDYKTGEPKINLDYSKYGINMQLPVYLYLAKNIKKFKNYNINYVGFYLQKICNNLSNDGINEKINSLKLQGYTNSNEDIIKKLDNNYANSQVIKGMKLTNSGFYRYAKLLNNNQINELINLVDKNINKNIIDILEANFDINPKKINNINVGCEYCNFKDICFKKESDIKNINNVEYKDFLGVGE